MPIVPKRSVAELSDYPAAAASRHQSVRMDSGENTIGFPEHYPAGVPALSIAAYPEYDELLARLSAFYHVDPDCLLLTNGSDNALALIAQTFIEPGVDSAVVSHPSFVVIPRSAVIAGANVISVKVKSDLAFDLDGIESALKSAPKLAMFASPDNPTGAVLPDGIVEKWCAGHPETLFVIDEAYFEFSGYTVLPFCERFDNLIVTRTFSKAWSLAGLRLGVVIGNEQLIRMLKRVRLPYDVNGVAVQVALRLLARADQVAAQASEAVRRKAALVNELRLRELKVLDGKGNFFLLDLGADAANFAQYFADRNVLVRPCSRATNPHDDILYGKIRISTGTDAENATFLDVLDQYAKSQCAS